MPFKVAEGAARPQVFLNKAGKERLGLVYYSPKGQKLTNKDLEYEARSALEQHIEDSVVAMLELLNFGFTDSIASQVRVQQFQPKLRGNISENIEGLVTTDDIAESESLLELYSINGIRLVEVHKSREGIRVKRCVPQEFAPGFVNISKHEYSSMLVTGESAVKAFNSLV